MYRSHKGVYELFGRLHIMVKFAKTYNQYTFRDYDGSRYVRYDDRRRRSIHESK
jgi:hypothetical protein